METTNNQALDKIIEDIDALSEDCALTLHLYADALADYETDEYRAHPESVLNCFSDGLEDDVNEVIYTFKYIEDREAANEILKRLHQHLKVHSPVTFFTLSPLFDYFGINSGEVIYHRPVPGGQRFRMPNLQINRRRQTEFFMECGLRADKSGGKGSHIKWLDEAGRFCTIGSNSDKLWLKNDIKTLLNFGLPIAKIAEACENLGIPFEIL